MKYIVSTHFLITLTTMFRLLPYTLERNIKKVSYSSFLIPINCYYIFFVFSCFLARVVEKIIDLSNSFKMILSIFFLFYTEKHHEIEHTVNNRHVFVVNVNNDDNIIKRVQQCGNNLSLTYIFVHKLNNP